MLFSGEYFITASKLTYHFEFSPIKVNGWCDKDPDSLDSSRGNKETSVLVEDHVIIDVACGPEHTVAMTPDGRVFTWGFGGYGRLGHNTNENEMLPRLLMHMKPSNVHTGGACRIFAGGSSCFVESRTQKQMFFWGQLKASGEATMYPKRYEDISSVAPEVFDVGMKHVLVSDGTNTFSMVHLPPLPPPPHTHTHTHARTPSAAFVCHDDAAAIHDSTRVLPLVLSMISRVLQSSNVLASYPSFHVINVVLAHYVPCNPELGSM